MALILSRFDWHMAAILALMLALLSGPVLAQPEVRIYPLHNRTAQDMASQIQNLYQSSPVTISARGQQLVARGEPELLDEIGRLVQTLDVAPIQMRVSVRYQQDIGGKQSGAGITLNNQSVRGSVQQKTISTNRSRQRQLIVQSGQSAHITSGTVRTLPFAIQGGRNPAAILQQVETRSGFVVSPHAISDQSVELNIVSFEADPAAIPGYDTEALMTVRRVQPGQWVSLGGIQRSEERSSQGIVYRVEGNRSENQNIEVKVDIVP